MRDDDSHEAARQERLRVFLCHSSKDKSKVRDLCRRLRDDGFQPWLDKEDLLVGQDWEIEIQKAVRANHAVIVCLSPNSVSDPGYFQKEILDALKVAEEQPEGKIYILPVRFESCEIPRRLRGKHCANLFEEDGYSHLAKALRKCARDSGVYVPEPELKHHNARDVSGTVADNAKLALPPPNPIPARPKPSTKPVRPRIDRSASNKTARSRFLPLSGGALLVTAFAVIVGLGLSNCRGENVVAVPADNSAATSLVASEATRPGSATAPEPQADKTPELPPIKTPEQPPATPTPAEPPPEAQRIENKDGAPSLSPDGSTPPALRESSSLSRYSIHIFLTRDSQKQNGFREDISRHLKRYAGGVVLRDKPFKRVEGCQLRYLNVGKGDARNEDAAASVLVNHLNSIYPKADFKGKAVRDLKTPNIITLVIGSGCKI